MSRMYESTGTMFIACPCGLDDCEVEVETLYGLDLPFTITKIPDCCPTAVERHFTPLEKGKIIHQAYAQHEKDQERLQGRE